MPHPERAFVFGEYVAGGVTAIAMASVIHAIVTPAWDMALAMLVGGLVGMGVHLVVALLAGPLLGMFPVMASGSLIGSYGGMIFGMRDSMQAASWGRVWVVAALFGLAVVAGVRLYDRALRTRVIADSTAEDTP
jgi:hypothetical protein